MKKTQKKLRKNFEKNLKTIDNYKKINYTIKVLRNAGVVQW